MGETATTSDDGVPCKKCGQLYSTPGFCEEGGMHEASMAQLQKQYTN